MYNYKYNGKELQDELGVNIYDYGARNYDHDGMEAEECETCNQLLGFAAAVIDNGSGGFFNVRQSGYNSNQ